MLKKREEEKGKNRYFDYTLLFLVIFMLGFGLVMLYSVSSYTAQVEYSGDSFHYVKSQLQSELIGCVLLIFFMKIDYHRWFKFGFLIYLAACALCAAVYTPLGIESGGQSRWISIGGVFTFQPSEAAKLGLIVFMAVLLCKTLKSLKNPATELAAFVFAVILAAIAGFNNLSTGIILGGIAFVMIFVASPKKIRHFMAIFAVLAGLIAIATIVAGGYRSTRIAAWLNPEQYADDAYQTLQGLYAIGSGGLFGKGLGASMQKLGFVPEAQNDMIFSIICEELGLFGAVGTILLFVLLIWRFMVIANNAPDLFGSLIVVGVMTQIALQVILNIAVVTNTIPNTGITLPFISYGGSSVLILLSEMGLVLNISSQVRLDDEPLPERRFR